MCAFSLPVRKTNAAVFDNRGLCATLISNQGHRADMGLFVRKCMRATEGLKREEGRNTLKYVDDLLICARDEVTCVADTVTLLNHLAREGHKVSLTKLQFVQQEIFFFGSH